MIVLPWQKKSYILAAEANLRAQFERHRDLMIDQLAVRLNLAPEMVRQVLENSAADRPVPERPSIAPLTIAPGRVSR